jgi:hypothetical protein
MSVDAGLFHLNPVPGARSRHQFAGTEPVTFISLPNMAGANPTVIRMSRLPVWLMVDSDCSPARKNTILKKDEFTVPSGVL